MAKGKNSFLLYTNTIFTVEKLTNEQAGKLFKHLLRYVNDLDPQTDDIVVDIAFEPIKQQLKADLKKYESIVNRNKNNIDKRWEKETTKNTTGKSGTTSYKKTTKNTDIDIDIDIDIDNDNDIDIIDNNIIIEDNKLSSDKSNTDPSVIISKDNKDEKTEKKSVAPKNFDLPSLSKPLHIREQLFIAVCKSLSGNYDPDMIDDFIRYWTEPNKLKTKMRYENEKTWDTARRLITWEKRSDNYKPLNKTPAQRRGVSLSGLEQIRQELRRQ